MAETALSAAPSATEIEAFLQRFFTEPNGITLSKIEEAKGPAAASVREWLAELRQSRGVVILPCLRGGAREWYGLAFNERQYRALLELIGAFVGPSYSTFRGGSGAMASTDPIDRVALEFTRGHALKFAVPSDELLATGARNALDHMRTLLRKRPAFASDAPSPTGRILRDYYMALRASDRNAADRHLRRLEVGFRLDPINLLFLRVQRYAEFGEWEALLALPELGDLLALRRPIAVTEALLTAVYRTHFAPFEADALQVIVERFRSEVYPRFAGLFVSRAGLKGSDAQKLYMMFAVAGPAPSPALRDQILAEVNSSDGTELIRRLAALLPPTAIAVPATESFLARAERAVQHGQYEEAFAISVDLPESVDRARVLLDSAHGLGSTQASKIALDALRKLSDGVRTSILSDRRRRAAYDWLVAQAPPGDEPSSVSALPGDWFQWLETVEAHPDWPQAVQLARRGAVEWGLEDFLNDSRGPTEFGRRLNAATASEPVRLALPHLLEFFETDANWPRREFAPIYRSMIELLVFTSGIGDEDLTVFHQLVQAMLSFGGGSESYLELVGYAQDLLRDYAARSRIDWALDMLDLLLSSECPAPDARLSFAASVAGAFQKYSRWITPVQQRFLSDLCQDLGHPELIPPQAVPKPEDVDKLGAGDPLSRLGGRSVAVYTLTENAGRRFVEVLMRECPSVVAETNHDHVATNQLKHLARNADVFIMVTASAKHAATLFIQSQRPSDLPLIRPSGKGTASMLRAIRGYAETLSDDR
jgi:hypothetical protein